MGHYVGDGTLPESVHCQVVDTLVVNQYCVLSCRTHKLELSINLNKLNMGIRMPPYYLFVNFCRFLGTCIVHVKVSWCTRFT